MSDIYFIHVFNITWDTNKAIDLPSEVVICDLAEDVYYEITAHPSDIAHYLSNTYGPRVLDFRTVEYTGDNPQVEEIIHRIGEEYAI